MIIERINKVVTNIKKPIDRILNKYKDIQVDYNEKEISKVGKERLAHPTKGNNLDIYV